MHAGTTLADIVARHARTVPAGVAFRAGGLDPDLGGDRRPEMRDVPRGEAGEIVHRGRVLKTRLREEHGATRSVAEPAG